MDNAPGFSGVILGWRTQAACWHALAWPSAASPHIVWKESTDNNKHTARTNSTIQRKGNADIMDHPWSLRVCTAFFDVQNKLHMAMINLCQAHIGWHQCFSFTDTKFPFLQLELLLLPSQLLVLHTSWSSHLCCLWTSRLLHTRASLGPTHLASCGYLRSRTQLALCCLWTRACFMSRHVLGQKHLVRALSTPSSMSLCQLLPPSSLHTQPTSLRVVRADVNRQKVSHQ